MKSLGNSSLVSRRCCFGQSNFHQQTVNRRKARARTMGEGGWRVFGKYDGANFLCIATIAAVAVVHVRIRINGIYTMEKALEVMKLTLYCHFKLLEKDEKEGIQRRTPEWLGVLARCGESGGGGYSVRPMCMRACCIAMPSCAPQHCICITFITADISPRSSQPHCSTTKSC